MDSKIFNYKDIGKNIFYMAVVAYGQLFRSKLIKNMEFPKGLIFEDNPFFIEAMLKSKRISFLDEHLYYRRIRPNSITTTSENKNFSDTLTIANKIIDITKRYGEYDNFSRTIITRKLESGFGRFQQVNIKYKQDFFNKLKQDFITHQKEFNEVLSSLTPEIRCIYELALTCDTYKEYQLSIDLFKSKLKLAQFEKNEENLYQTARFDLKNYGGETNSIEFIQNNNHYLKIDKPKWFNDEKGQGWIIENNSGVIDLKLRIINDGEFKLLLRSLDMKDKNGKMHKILIDYTSLIINNIEYIEDHEIAWHDEPFIFSKSVKNSELLNIHIEWTVQCNLKSYVQTVDSFNKKYLTEDYENKNQTYEFNILKDQNQDLRKNLNNLEIEMNDLISKYDLLRIENRKLIIKQDYLENKNKRINETLYKFKLEKNNRKKLSFSKFFDFF